MLSFFLHVLIFLLFLFFLCPCCARNRASDMRQESLSPKNMNKTLTKYGQECWNLVARAIRNAIRANRFARIVETPLFVARQADSHESLEFPIRANHATKMAKNAGQKQGKIYNFGAYVCSCVCLVCGVGVPKRFPSAMQRK